MNSKQLNFFITPEDHGRIGEFLRRSGALILVKQHIDDGAHIRTILPDAAEEIYQVHLAKEEFIKNLKIESTPNGKKYYDIVRSPILQISLGGFYPYDKNLLQRGRFYYIKKYYDDNEDIVNKSEEFIKWCDTLIKAFKKEFLVRYPKEKYFWYSESAIKWIEENQATLINGGQQWKPSKANSVNP